MLLLLMKPTSWCSVINSEISLELQPTTLLLWFETVQKWFPQYCLRLFMFLTIWSRFTNFLLYHLPFQQIRLELYYCAHKGIKLS